MFFTSKFPCTAEVSSVGLSSEQTEWVRKANARDVSCTDQTKAKNRLT